MKLHEKIRYTRERLGLTIQDVSEKLFKIFGERAISYRTIYRVEKGKISKFHSVEQIAFGLGVPLPTLLKDTELENCQVIRKKDEVDRFSGDGFEAKIISSPTCSFLTTRDLLEPKRERPLEQSPTTDDYEKLIHILKGELTCFIGEEKYLLKEEDSISFKSTIKHRLKNEGPGTCEFITIQNPKHF